MKIQDRKKIKSTSGRVFTGIVVSTKMTKTVVVEVTQITRHRLYNKPVKKTRRFLVHYDGLELLIGETVRIIEVRPLSKNIHFVVKEKVII